jgi:hypothetical protein
VASYNGNNVYLKIGGVQVDAYWKSVELSPSLETVDVTAGSNTAHRERNEGLADTSLTATIVYDSATIQTYIQTLKPGTYTVEFGPEGNVAGKPKHIQSFILTEAPFSVEVEKTEVAFQLSFEAAAAPTFNMFAGSVW